MGGGAGKIGNAIRFDDEDRRIWVVGGASQRQVAQLFVKAAMGRQRLDLRLQRGDSRNGLQQNEKKTKNKTINSERPPLSCSSTGFHLKRCEISYER